MHCYMGFRALTWLLIRSVSIRGISRDRLSSGFNQSLANLNDLEKLKLKLKLKLNSLLKGVAWKIL